MSFDVNAVVLKVKINDENPTKKSFKVHTYANFAMASLNFCYVIKPKLFSLKSIYVNQKFVIFMKTNNLAFS